MKHKLFSISFTLVIILRCQDILILANEDSEDVVNTYEVYLDEVICLLLKCAFTLIIPAKGQREGITYHINSTYAHYIEYHGQCNEKNSTLRLRWSETGKDSLWILGFTLVVRDLEYTLKAISLKYKLSHESFNAQAEEELFTVPIGSYYKCSEEQRVQLVTTGAKQQKAAELILEDFALEAFRYNYKHNFVGTKTECELDPSERNSVTLIVTVSLFIMAVSLLLALYVSSEEF